MKNQYTIFYSWQSDIEKNKTFISSCLKDAIEEIKKKNGKEINLEIKVERDTKGKSGSPSISETI